MERTETENVFDKERLVISAAVLVERDKAGSGSARRGEEARTNIARTASVVVERVTLEGCITMVNQTSEGEGAATEHGAFAPAQPRAEVEAAVVELLITKNGVCGKGTGYGVDVPGRT